MKVVFVTTESTMDHSYTMIDELKKHIDLCVVFVAKTESDEIKTFCRHHNAIFFRRTRFSNPLGIFHEIKLLRFIKKQRADCVWFNTFSFMQSVLMKFFISKGLIVNAHDIKFHPGERNYHGRLSQKITFRFYRDSIAVMSKTQAEIFKQKYGRYPYVLQLPIIDYYEKSANRNLQRHEKQEDKKGSEKIKFFFFGSILPYKGIETLIEAARILENRTDKFVVNIHGKILYNKTLILESIKQVKSISIEDRYIDYREVFDIFDGNDVIIIPYRQVTQCGPLLIAYNQNKPLICSDLPGFREYVEAGKSGFLFDNTPGGLAGMMKEIIENREVISRMSGYIASSIKNRFSMTSLADSYLKCFNDAAWQSHAARQV